MEFNNTTRKVYIKFRNAKFDSNGFINSEQLIPIQGTSSNIPVAGGGVQSNEIYVFNATVQHEDVQDLKTFLNNWKTGNWDVNTFPLTKRPKKIKLCKSDSSYFPIISSATVACLELRYRYKGDSFFQSLGYCYAEPVVNILTVTNVIKTNGSNYNIFFTANFTLNIIKAEVSIDGVNWSIPTTSPSLLSPYNRVISLGTPFYVRLINGLGANAVYSNIYTFN